MRTHNFFVAALVCALFVLLCVRPAAAVVEQVSSITLSGWKIASGSGATETRQVVLMDACREHYNKRYFAAYRCGFWWRGVQPRFE